MAFTPLGVVAQAQNKTSATTLVASVTASVAAGTLLVARYVGDNTSTANTNDDTTAVTSVTDSNGNTWTRALTVNRGAGAAAAGVVASLWYAVVTSALDTSDTITATIPTARTAKALEVRAYTIGAARVSVAISAGANGSSTSPSIASGTAPAAGAGRLWLGLTGIERPTTDANPTIGGAWTATPGEYGTSGSTTTTNVLMAGGESIGTATSQTWASTHPTASDWAALVVALDEDAMSGAGAATTEANGTLTGAEPAPIARGVVTPVRSRRAPSRGRRPVIFGPLIVSLAAPATPALAGSLSATANASAVLSVAKPLDGAVGGSAASVGVLSVAKPLAASGDATATASAALTGVAAGLVGTGSGTATATALLVVPKPLAADGTASSTVIATLAVAKPLAGDGAATADATGNLSGVSAGMTATATATTTVNAALSVSKPLAANASGTASGSAALWVPKPLAADLIASAVATAAVTAGTPAPSVAARGTLTPIRARHREAPRRGGPQITVGRQIVRPVPLEATIATTTIAAADLTTGPAPMPLAARGVLRPVRARYPAPPRRGGPQLVVGRDVTPTVIDLSGSISATASVVGLLTPVGAGLSSTLVVTATVSGGLTVPKPLDTTAVVVVGIAADLTIPKPLGASALGAASSTAGLRVPKPLAALGTATGDATGTLLAPGAALSAAGTATATTVVTLRGQSAPLAGSLMARAEITAAVLGPLPPGFSGLLCPGVDTGPALDPAVQLVTSLVAVDLGNAPVTIATTPRLTPSVTLRARCAP